MPPSYTLYSPAGSFRALAPLIAAEYNGVDIDVVTDAVEDAIKAKSPTGKAPILETPDGVIFSSHAIARYVGGLRRDTGLLGSSSSSSSSSIQDRAAVDQWMDWTAQSVELPACVWFYPVAGYMAANEEATAKAKEDMKSALKKVNDSLGDNKQSFLVGDKITLADIVLACTLLYPFKLVCDKTFLAPYPNVIRWYEACVGQAEFQAVIGKVEICETPLSK